MPENFSFPNLIFQASMNQLNYLVLFSFLLACTSGSDWYSQKENTNKLYIYTTVNDCVAIDWYCYSNIGGFSASKIDFTDKKTNCVTTIESYYVSDIQMANDTFRIQLWKNDISGIDATKIPCFTKIEIDITGDQNKDGLDARISRMIEAKIDFTKPHSFNSKAK